MGGAIEATGGATAVPQAAELPPHLVKAMATLGLEPAQARGAWGTYGMSVDLLPMVLSARGMTGEQVGQQLAAVGVTSADFPAIADFLGVPADQRAPLAALLKLPDPKPAATSAGSSEPVAAPMSPPTGDTVRVNPAVSRSDSASPLTTIFANPAVKKAIVAQVVDRDPDAIGQDRAGLIPEVGLTIGDVGDVHTVGVRFGLGKELGRLQVSGTRAGGMVASLDAVGGVNVMAGSASGLVSGDASLRGEIGRAWGMHSQLLHLSAETKVGVYAVAGVVAYGGALDGNGAAGVGVRVGGGAEVGPLYVETTRAYTTGGDVDQASAGLRLGF